MNESATTTSRARLDRELAQGLAWTGLFKWIVLGLSWINTLIVARLLQPSDYGTAGAALIFVAFIQLVNEFGLSAAIINHRDLGIHALARLNTLSFLFGTTCAAVAWLAAASVADFNRNPDVMNVLRALSVLFLLSGIQLVPRAILSRDLRYRELAILDATEALAATVTTLGLAVSQWGYWSLVGGVIAGRLVATLMVVAIKWPSFAFPLIDYSLRPALATGFNVMMAGVAWYVFRSGDSQIAGRELGATALGYYTMALSLALIPLDRLNELVSRVMPGILSAVQKENHEIRRYVIGVSRALSLVSFPASVGLALTAPDLIPVLLGEKWNGAVLPCQILAMSLPFRILVPIWNHALIAKGSSKTSFQATLLAAIIMPPAYWFASSYGLGAIALTWVLLYPCLMLPTLVRQALRLTELNIGKYLAALRPALEGTAAMAVAVLLANHIILQVFQPFIRLAISVLLGLIVYGAWVGVQHRTALAPFETAWRQLRLR